MHVPARRLLQPANVVGARTILVSLPGRSLEVASRLIGDE
jgi:hypothetical protein